MSTSMIRSMVIFMVGAVGLMPAAAGAGEGNLDVGGHSAYVWRGQVYNDDPVLQPSFTASTDWGLSFNAWGNFNLTDKLGADVEHEFNEVDLTVSFAFPLESFNIEVGLAEYVFPHSTTETEGATEEETVTVAAKGTRDVFVSAGLNTILSPTLTVSYDLDEVDGFYAQLEISHSIEIAPGLEVGLSLWAGGGDGDYNTYYFGNDAGIDVDKTALNDGNAKLKLDYTLSSALCLSGYVQYTTLLSSDIKDAADALGKAEVLYNDGDIVLGGVSASYTF